MRASCPLLHEMLPRFPSVTSIGTRSTLEASCLRGLSHVPGESAARIGDDQRDVDRLLVRRSELARQQAVRAGVLAVVGGEHDHRVGQLGLRDRGNHIADRLIDHLLHERVHVEPTLPVAVRRDGHAKGLRLRPARTAPRTSVTLGSSGAPPHTASWNDRITCWVSGLPCAGRSAYDSQFGGIAGNPNGGGLSSLATDV